jgi:hypothetical protein
MGDREKADTCMERNYKLICNLLLGIQCLLRLLSPVPGDPSERSLPFKFTQLIFKIPDRIVDPA